MTADVRPMKTMAETALAEAYASAKARLPGNRVVAEQREAAFLRFDREGLPHRRIEEWKYTDLRALLREAKPLAVPPGAGSIARANTAGRWLGNTNARRLVFVDGSFVAELSDLSPEPGLSVRSMASALAEGDLAVVARVGRIVPNDDIAVTLNTAFMGDGAVIRVADRTTLARPLHLVFAYGAERASAVFSRSLIEIGAKAQATILESHEGPDGIDYQVNGAVDIALGDDATLDLLKVGAEGRSCLHVGTAMVAIGARARLRAFLFTTGGSVVRNQLFVRYDGADADVDISGASLINGRQHLDTTLVVDHAMGGGRSRELFKTVLDGEAQGVFQGKIIVRPHAQKTDGRMMSRALLLSPDAEAVNKPELEIFADDVQCGHGATAGALDQELLFYLRARGIPEAEAQALLVQAFVGEAVELVRQEDIKEALMAAAVNWLAARA